MDEVRISLSLMTELAQAPGLAVVLKERWKYSTWTVSKPTRK